MNIYKLNYDNKEDANADFLDKGVTQEVEFEGVKSVVYANGTQSLVDVGKLVETAGTYDPDGKEITPPVLYDGIFYDLMTTDELDFGTHTLFPVNCVHGFAGYNVDANGENVEPE